MYKVVEVPRLPSLFLVLFLVGAFASAIIGILLALEGDFVKTIVCFGLAIVCGVLLSPLRSYCKRNYTKERYEVKISDTLSAEELVENWNIIEARGDILVLERREADGNE